MDDHHRASLCTSRRYRVTQRIASGCFSTFYKCTDRGSAGNPFVGLKIVKNDKDCFDTGNAEARVLYQIQHRGGAAHHLLRHSSHPSLLLPALTLRPLT